jgi:hypothetical protein
MTTEDNPYGADAEMKRGAALLSLISEGYDGEQIEQRFHITAERAEELIVRYVRRVLRGDAPPAPSAQCLVGGYDGWCARHGCFHPAAKS